MSGGWELRCRGAFVIRPYEFGQVPIATPIANGSIVKGGGKVGHVGGSNVDIAAVDVQENCSAHRHQ